MGISRREYAQLRGVSETAVRKAIAVGRISAEPDGSIDPEKANRQWDEHTDPAFQRGKHARNLAVAGAAAAKAACVKAGAVASPPDMKPVPQAALDAVRETLKGAGLGADEVPGGKVSMLHARLAREIIKVQLDKLRLGREKKNLVERTRAETLIFRLAREERDAWVNWPARVAALMAAELGTETAAMQKVLEAHVRAHLEELAQPRIAL